VLLEQWEQRGALVPGEMHGGDIALAGAFQRPGLRSIGDDEYDLGRRCSAELIEMVEDGLKVAAAAGGEHGEARAWL
jgi:hypothetical protein